MDSNNRLISNGSKRLPKLHKDILFISLKNYKKIKKAYSPVLGLNGIDHLSINIVNPNDEMVFLSATPYTGINVCKNGLWLYDSSIHPDMYENNSFYWWEDCYSPQMKQVLKMEKEIKNNLAIGFIISKKVDDFYLLYSFATKEKDPEIRYMIKNYQEIFNNMGDHCYSAIKSVYEEYVGLYEPPQV